MIPKAKESVPAQREGAEVNVEDSVRCATDAEARSLFLVVKDRLLRVNHWHHLAGALSASFQLTDARGNEIDRTPAEGDYFKIDIPAPGNQTGEGNDWVRVEAIDVTDGNAEECVSVRVRPASSPLNDHHDVAHFYTEAATSNFIVSRKGNTVTAGVYGRNEKPNIESADTVVDKVRNAIVGTGGATGFSKLQWRALVSGLLNG